MLRSCRKDGETLRASASTQSMDVKAVITILLFHMNGTKKNCTEKSPFQMKIKILYAFLICPTTVI